MIRLLLITAAGLLGCGTIGTEGSDPGELPHNGVGPFRALTSTETSIRGGPPGRVVPLPRDAFDSGMVCADRLFYVSAALLPDAGPQPEDLPQGDVDWSLFEHRRIYRAEPNDARGFLIGEPVLTAEQAWEGAEVYDPWAIQLPDGRTRLYYAAAGGIGLAEAPSVGGAFSRVGGAALLVSDAALPLRRPSVVRSPTGDGYLMFLDVAGSIRLARSSDGVEFALDPEPLDLGAGPPDEPAEVAVGAPGAVRVETPAGRSVVRLYFEAVREDDSRVLSLAATADGLRFDRLARAVVDDVDRRMPAPLVLDDRLSLLYHTAPWQSGDRQLRALVVGVAPFAVTFTAEP